MYRENVQPIIDLLKRTIRKRPTGSDEDTHQVARLSQAILDYGRMFQHHYSTRAVIVKVPDLSNRFRETSGTILKALRLLEQIGHATPIDRRECWNLQLRPAEESDHRPASV